MEIKPIVTEILREADPSNPTIMRAEKTIGRYAKPKGCCKTLIYIMRRMMNAVLSLIGCSEWQRTVRAMRKDNKAALNNWFKVVRDSVHVNQNLSPKDRKQILKTLDRIVDSTLKAIKSLPNETMDLAIKLQNGEVDVEAIHACSKHRKRCKRGGDVLDAQIILESYKVKDMPKLADQIKRELAHLDSNNLS